MTQGAGVQDQGWKAETVGPMTSWGDLLAGRPQGPSLKGKGFLGARLGLTAMEVSLNALPAGESYSFSHAHKTNEELYLFLSGTGEMLLDGQVVPVGPGSAVRISPPVFRCWRNTGDSPLTCIVVQAKAGSLEQATFGDGIRAPEPPCWPQR